MSVYNHGINNRSADCYMNSIFQCLMATEDFITYFDTITQPNDNLIVLISKLIKDFQKENHNIINCDVLKQYIQKLNNTYFVGIQNDSQEFLIFLLNKLHELLKKQIEFVIKDSDQDELRYIKLEKKYEENKENNIIKKYIIDFKSRHYVDYAFYEFKKFKKFLYSKDYSEIQNIFGTIISSEIKCSNCGNINITLNSELIINIQLQKEFKTLYDCLDSYTGKEQLTKDNLYKCEFCNKLSNACKNLTIYKPPKNIIITFKRFKYDNRTEKINTPIECPMILDISSYCHTSLVQKSSKYKLYAINYHMGTPTGGHYISDCKNFTDKKWYNCNDSSIILNTELNNIELENIKTNAYIVFYKKYK